MYDGYPSESGAAIMVISVPEGLVEHVEGLEVGSTAIGMVLH